MEKVKETLLEFMDENLRQITLSDPREKDGFSKVKVRPVLLKGELFFQLESFDGKKAFHENLPKDAAVEKITGLLSGSFRQLQLEAAGASAAALVSKKGKVTLKVKRTEAPDLRDVKYARNLSHNRKKRYLLPEGTPVRFLVDLGIMTPEGKIVNAKYDKYRQINRFLEFIEDIADRLPKEREITILDFGCGKSYLTFAMYEYLRVQRGLDVRIVGLDLKEDVIEHCSRLSREYGYDKLSFWLGDVADYEEIDHVDMVVTLHACDTATDYALYKAVKWGARVILSVPCCQHELNGQIHNDTLQPVFRYGILKERMAALFTDGMRAELLRQQGYDVQILEFIDMEHTPKNLLIRAVKTGVKAGNDGDYRALSDFLHADSTLERLFREDT